MKLFRKPKSKFYWYKFTVRGCRYPGSTQEAKSIRALRVASLKLASVMETAIHFQASLPLSVSLLTGFSTGSKVAVEEKIRKFYRNGWRLLKTTAVAEMRIDKITGDCAEQLKFPGSDAE